MEKRNQLPANPGTRDPASHAKARADWANVQEVADRRYTFPASKRAYLQMQSARITRNINEMEMLEHHDALVFGPQLQDEAGRGRWPYG